MDVLWFFYDLKVVEMVVLLLKLLLLCGREKEERNRREKVPCNYLVKNEVK